MNNWGQYIFNFGNNFSCFFGTKIEALNMILALGLDFGGINNLKLIKEKPSVFSVFAYLCPKLYNVVK